MICKSHQVNNRANLDTVNDLPGMYSRRRDELVEQFANMTEVVKFKTATEQRDKFLKDLRRYQPLKDFSPRATVPKAFLFRTEVRAKLRNLQSKTNHTHATNKKHFRVRPMPDFGNTALLFSSFTGKERSMTEPQTFYCGTDMITMRSPIRTRDDSEVGRFRFKPLVLPDFTYRPSGSMHDVNLILPSSLQFQIDEKIAGKIRLNGTSRPKDLCQAVLSPHIITEKVTSPLYSNLVVREKNGARSSSTSERKCVRKSILSRGGKPPSDRSCRRTCKERDMPVSRRSFGRADTVSFAEELVYSKSQERNRSRSPALLQIRTRSKSITPVKKRNVGPPMNYITRSRSRTPTRSCEEQCVESGKFRAKPMPDFSRPPRARSSSKGTVGRKSCQTFNSMVKPPIHNDQSVRNTTPPPKQHSKNRKILTSPKPFNLSTRRKSRLPKTIPDKIFKDFKARPMPDFYANVSSFKVHNTPCQPDVGIMNAKPRIFKARPLPAFYMKNAEATRKDYGEKINIRSRTSRAGAMPVVCDDSSSLCNERGESGKDDNFSNSLKMGSSTDGQDTSTYAFDFDSAYHSRLGKGSERTETVNRYDNFTRDCQRKREKLSVINEEEDNESCSKITLDTKSLIIQKGAAERERTAMHEVLADSDLGACTIIDDGGTGGESEEILKKCPQEFVSSSYTNLKSEEIPIEQVQEGSMEGQGSHPCTTRELTMKQGDSKENVTLYDDEEKHTSPNFDADLRIALANQEAKLREKYGVLLNRWRIERKMKYSGWLTSGTRQIFCGHDSGTGTCDASCFRCGWSPEPRRTWLANIPPL